MSMDNGDAAKVIPLKIGKCPMCGKKATLEMKPFCSKRCADLDLGQWLDGGYRLPTDEVPGDDDFIPHDDPDET